MHASDERNEYAKLVMRELECGKLLLRTSVEAVADVFAISKSDGQAQRKIWSGDRISSQAYPKPDIQIQR